MVSKSFWLLPVLAFSCGLNAAPLERGALPGRQVRVSAICIGFGGDHETKLRLATEHLHAAGTNGVDIACLPEEFAGTTAETIPGPTTIAVSQLAKQYHMYIICPIREAAGAEQYNTAVLIDRTGEIIGYYRKVFVFWGEGLHCSKEGVKTFDLDFGRIGILICFDANFPELWQECYDQNVDIVFWPSAYGGGIPLNGYAMIYNYYIVPVGRGNIIDITGKPCEDRQQPLPNQFVATIDLDRTIIHKDFNKDKLDKLLGDYKERIAVEQECPMEGWWRLKSTAPGLRVRDVLPKYQIETLRQYRQRSRIQINQARQEGKRI
ncbi:MAG: carbon-nitrogen hydrolase family protein [Sedimentisphaerales bacterium]|nr:carbon-nitrogen hydrolase family protein [Sedimentisphaerales bacterium]